MKKNQAYLIVVILAAGIAGWFGYKYFFDKKNNSSYKQEKTAQSFLSNSCWIYHEYVYRVDFSDTALQPFLFIRSNDGTFSPSKADSSGNHIIGNGFILDSTGVCISTQEITEPWRITVEERKSLREMVEEWLEPKDQIENKDFVITGQTVALFVVLNDPKDFIEYVVSSQVPGQQGYSIIHPFKKTQLRGIVTGIAFPDDNSVIGESVFQVLKTTFNENDIENPTVKTSIDSILATRTSDGYLDNIKVIKGDEFFYEGSVVFDKSGKCLGNLHYEDKRWRLIILSRSFGTL